MHAHSTTRHLLNHIEEESQLKSLIAEILDALKEDSVTVIVFVDVGSGTVRANIKNGKSAKGLYELWLISREDGLKFN